MEKRLFPERPSLPPDHPGGGDGDPVDPSRPVRDVTPNRLEALTPEELTLPGDVILALEAVGIRAVSTRLTKDRAGNSERGIFLEPAKEELEEILVERYIGIKVAYHLMIAGFDLLIARIEGMHLGRKASISTFRHAHHFDPIVDGRVAPDDPPCTVRRSIVHNNPSDRANALVDH